MYIYMQEMYIEDIQGLGMNLKFILFSEVKNVLGNLVLDVKYLS